MNNKKKITRIRLNQTLKKVNNKFLLHIIKHLFYEESGTSFIFRDIKKKCVGKYMKEQTQSNS